MQPMQEMATQTVQRAAARYRVAITLSLLLSLACGSNPMARSETPIAIEELSPDELDALAVVDGLQTAMIAIMQQGPALGYQGRFDALAVVARESFDIPAMARASYGSGFTDLSSDQQRQWIEIYERFHISSLADVRDEYSGQTWMILDASQPQPGIVMIGSKLEYPGRNVDLFRDYRLRSGSNGWQIIDVFDPPTVSEVAMRRAEYRTVLERAGFEGLIEEMESRIRRRERP
jgi:phospholipid transport system substrate-binding protein